MRYVLGVLLPVLIQGLLVVAIIQMNTGNGSWLGLGALLVGAFAIPGTGVYNFVFLRKPRALSAAPAIGRCFLHAAVAPFIVLIFYLFA